MNRSTAINQNQAKLLHAVKEAITASTKNEVAISPVKLATIFQTSHSVIEHYLNQFVDDRHIVRVKNEHHYPKVIYRLPE
ncbi:MAG TPA: hypothetical protein VNM45_01510 [Bacillus sp. (in: firmicutes)]|nr:hypothetical protein [Bacillus sp. (in: firmicutes)]